MSGAIAILEATPVSASTLGRGLTHPLDLSKEGLMPDPTERWLPVVGWEGLYEVSDQGRVQSIDRIGRGNRGQDILYRGRVLRPSHIPDGHQMVVLSRDGQRATRWVHILVAEAFIGPRPDGLEVCHNNGDPTDNRRRNLRYDTHSANLLDAVKHGRNQHANKITCPKGHPYDYVAPSGGRRCKTCDAEREARRVRRKQ